MNMNTNNNQGRQSRNNNNRDRRDYRGNRPNNNSGNRDNRDNKGARPNNRPSGNPGRPQQHGHQSSNSSRSHHHHSQQRVDPEQILRKYDNLLDNYLQARRKYFETFGNGEDRELRKCQDLYDQSLEALRKFERDLPSWQQRILARKTDRFNVIQDYALQNNLSPYGERPAFTEQREDPHVSNVQLERPNFKEDTEESVGTMEDYYKLKSSR